MILRLPKTKKNRCFVVKCELKMNLMVSTNGNKLAALSGESPLVIGVCSETLIRVSMSWTEFVDLLEDFSQSFFTVTRVSRK